MKILLTLLFLCTCCFALSLNNSYRYTYYNSSFYGTSGEQIAVDKQGHIIIAGGLWSTRDGDRGPYIALWKFLPDGTLDKDWYNGYGFYTARSADGKSKNHLSSFVLDSEDYIYAVGDTDLALTIWKLYGQSIENQPTYSGLDYRFGQHGGAIFKFSDYIWSQAWKVRLDNSGNLIVYGGALNKTSFQQDLMFWKFTKEGLLDTNWGTNGYALINSIPKFSIQNFIIDPNGNFLLVGYDFRSTADYDMIVQRYNPSGMLNLTIRYHVDGYAFMGDDIVIDTNGNMYITGRINTLNNFDDCKMIVWKYNTNGILDTTFGNKGIGLYQVQNGQYHYDHGRRMILGNENKLYIAANGNIPNMKHGSLVLWAITLDGLNSSWTSVIDDTTDIYPSNMVDYNNKIYMTGSYGKQSPEQGCLINGVYLCDWYTTSSDMGFWIFNK